MSNGLIELILENGIELGIDEAVEESSDGVLNDALQNDISEALGKILSEAAEDIVEAVGDIHANPTIDKLDDVLEAYGEAANSFAVIEDILNTLNRTDLTDDQKAARVLIDVIEKLTCLSGDPSALADRALEIRQAIDEAWQQLYDDHPELFESGLGENGLPIPITPDPPNPQSNDKPQTPVLDNPDNVVPSTPNERPFGEPIAEGTAPKYGQAPFQGSPLVLDLGAAGIDLTSVDGPNAVYWDLDQDGMAEATGWAGPEDGLLALDRNGDGIVTDHTELFGTETEDGFVMLVVNDNVFIEKRAV